MLLLREVRLLGIASTSPFRFSTNYTRPSVNIKYTRLLFSSKPSPVYDMRTAQYVPRNLPLLLIKSYWKISTRRSWGKHRSSLTGALHCSERFQKFQAQSLLLFSKLAQQRNLTSCNDGNMLNRNVNE